MNFSKKDRYGSELDQALNMIVALGLAASIRGEGAARFLFAEQGGRALEISRDGQQVVLEFFEGEEPVKKDLVDDFHVAVQQTVTWLKN